MINSQWRSSTKTRMKTESSIPSTVESGKRTGAVNAHNKGRLTPIVVTAIVIMVGAVIAGIYREQITGFGEDLMTRYGREWVDVILFLITFVSCTPLMLPVWCYALIGAAMGFNIIRLAAVMALGSASGSLVTFYLGRYFANRVWVKKRFPNMLNHPWTEGKSKVYVSWILFLGTASPIPCDVFYAACGVKRYPAVPFLLLMIAGRFVRYIYLGYGFHYFSQFF
jgi:membrane protein YqaA with SNARE-associated domain